MAELRAWIGCESPQNIQVIHIFIVLHKQYMPSFADQVHEVVLNYSADHRNQSSDAVTPSMR